MSELFDRPATSPAAQPEEREARAFGGAVGALAMMSLLPVLTLYLWLCVHRHGGSLVLPSDILPFFYFLYFTPLLVDRERRDDAHCARKYGADWDRYRERVPHWIVPFI